MRLSIVIPVYQVEPYLRKCLDSCLFQTISQQNYEIICVNDGSRDGSLEILKEYESSYSNIKVISQSNQGLSSARNRGLKEAQGDYVWFIDSDDWIDSVALDNIIVAIDKEKNKGKTVDIVQLGFRFTYEDARLPMVKPYSHWDNCITGEEYMAMSSIPAGAQFNVYRRELLVDNKLFFKPGILHEDIEFKPRVLHYCRNCISIQYPIYNYLQRSSGSIMSQFKLKNGLDLITVMESLYRFTENHSIKGAELIYYYKRIAMSMNFLIKGSKSLTKSEKRILMEEIESHKNIFKAMVASSKFLYKIEGVLFWVAPKFTFAILTQG